MAWKRTYIGVDDRARRYVDLHLADASDPGDEATDAEAALALVPFTKVRAILVTLPTDTDPIDTGKAGAPAFDADDVEAVLTSLGDGSTSVNVRVIGA